MTVPITFRTNSSQWGSGKGANLDAAEVDQNFFELKRAIEDLIANPPTPIQIAAFGIAGTGMTITLSNGTVIGPLPLPILAWRWRNEWIPFSPYLALDVFSVADVGIFLVLQDHTSAATFDADALASGQPLYRQLIDISTPSLTVSDGTTTVDHVIRVDFTGASVTDLGAGAAGVEIITGGSDDVALLATVTLTASQIIAAHTTPFVVVPAPGAGKAIVVLGSSYGYTFATAAFTGGDTNAGLIYDAADHMPADAGGNGAILRQTSSKFAVGGPAIGNGWDNVAQFDNIAVSFFSSSSAFATGSGTLKISCIYAIVPT